MKNTTKDRLTKLLTRGILWVAIIEGLMVTFGNVKPLNPLFLGTIAMLVVLLLGVDGWHWWTNRAN